MLCRTSLASRTGRDSNVAIFCFGSPRPGRTTFFYSFRRPDERIALPRAYIMRPSLSLSLSLFLFAESRFGGAILCIAARVDWNTR